MLSVNIFYFRDKDPLKHVNRIVKEAICFRAMDFLRVVEILQLDTYEPPMSQVS